jgi:tetratricopeptide (TPR) repeat protein
MSELRKELKEELEQIEEAIATNAIDIGRCYEEVDDFEEAQRFYKIGVEILELQPGPMLGLAAAHLAMLYERLGNIKDAEKYHIMTALHNPAIGSVFFFFLFLFFFFLLLLL